jgi:protein-tyrosine phosphatase
VIDIHCHILHGLDDGPKTLDDSLAMLEAAAAAGTTDIAVTPHANVEYKFDPVLIGERLAELRAQTASDVRIYPACDFHLTFDNVADALAHPTKYTINNKNFLLVELSDMVIFNTTEPDFRRLRDAGIHPVITHPERNPLLRQRLDAIRRWISMGCYVQLTGQSLFGRFGRKAKSFSDILLREGLVHFVASDGHSVKHRPPTLDEAFRHVSKECGEKHAVTLFFNNPLAALHGDVIPADAVPAPAVRRKWFLPWR